MPKLKPILYLIQAFLLSGSILMAILWINLTASARNVLYTHPYFIISISLFLGYMILAIWNWNRNWAYRKEEIYELVIGRAEISLKSLAKSQKTSEYTIRDIIQELFAEKRIMGEFRDDTVVFHEGSLKKCGICNQSIVDSKDILVCKHCKRNFHRIHLIEYLEAQQHRCPLCSGRLNFQDFL